MKHQALPLRSPSGTASRIAGFSLLELMVVVGIMAVTTAITVLLLPERLRAAKADGEMQRLVSLLRNAKEMATSQRRDIEVVFDTATNQVQILRHEVPANPAPTLISTTTFEGSMRFTRFPTLPDTPDGFAGGASAVAFGGAAHLIFRTEGIFTDLDQNLDPISGTVFLGNPNDELSARAITVFGPSAMIRGYRWNGGAWAE